MTIKRIERPEINKGIFVRASKIYLLTRCNSFFLRTRFGAYNQTVTFYRFSRV